jgi:hypothetical protein
VNAALAQGSSIGLVPGGIAEMFEGYPKPNTKPSDEYSIVRKGFLRMAVQHGRPVVPVYCFGATKVFRRLQLNFLEHISNVLRISLCIFFGQFGLPIPFRQRLMYVMGDPIYPPVDVLGVCMDQRVDEMHKAYCKSLLKLFDRHKDVYGWAHKSLKLIER